MQSSLSVDINVEFTDMNTIHKVFSIILRKINISAIQKAKYWR
jgi:hypothetical protein